jgi:hypothetical protein
MAVIFSCLTTVSLLSPFDINKNGNNSGHSTKRKEIQTDRQKKGTLKYIHFFCLCEDTVAQTAKFSKY